MLDQSQLDHFRERQQLSLMDTCRRLVYSRTINDYNEPVETWSENSTDIPCGLEPQVGSEIGQDKETVVSYDAKLRIPINISFDEKDRVKIIKRYGETITPSVEYQIVSPLQVGPSGARLLLKKVSI